MTYTLQSYIQAVDSWEVKPEDIVNNAMDKISQDNKRINALITVTQGYAEEKLASFASLPLRGAPIAVKDNIMTKGIRTTCASKMLEDYIAPYDATCFTKLEESGWLMIGKANMDEFAMGSSWEYSAFWRTLNPLAEERVPGWSSSWSAAAVASWMALAALWTDTAWSVRLPAAFCWLVWAKPTYGRISRHWVQAMWSSFDQVGVITKTVEDAALLLSCMSWHDPLEATSIKRPKEELEDRKKNTSIEWLKLALPKQFFSQGLDSRVADAIKNQAVELQKLWAIVEEVDAPLFEEVLPVYYALMPAEVSTNLSRFDGIRFWKQSETSEFESLHNYYAEIRSQYFWDEVKRRILTWSYVLSSSNYEGFFLKAQKLRRMVANTCSSIYESYDAIIGPTVPELPREFWKKSADPLTMYLTDIYAVIANIVWLPAMSVPCGTIAEDGKNLPVWFHIMTNHWREDMMFRIGRAVENS